MADETTPPGPSAPAPAAPATPAAKPAPPAAAKPAAPAAAKAAAPAADHVPKAAPAAGPPDPPPPADKVPPAFIATLQAALPQAVEGISFWVGDWTVIVASAQMSQALTHLRDAPDALFDSCSDMTATDWPLRTEARFDLIYCLYSTRLRQRIRVKVKVGEQQAVPTATGIWPCTNWFEREIFDMFGVQFTGHPDLRRILLPEDWQGSPQRKDYPLEGPGELLMESPAHWLKLRQAEEEAEIE